MSKVESNDLQRQIVLLSENVNTDVFNQRKYLLGRVLTVIEAVTNDPEQRKAIKDVVQDLFYQGSYWNNLRWHFSQILKANGFAPLPDNKLVPTEEPVNIYEKV